eukprot:GFYU01014479.1.p1 GENE.GFYU01014479.1~~GFYU01014479.1.p1  ORF type:complete len:108 (-),score=3.67 GFYU01014479.1:332-655(-)
MPVSIQTSVLYDTILIIVTSRTFVHYLLVTVVSSAFSIQHESIHHLPTTSINHAIFHLPTHPPILQKFNTPIQSQMSRMFIPYWQFLGRFVLVSFMECFMDAIFSTS